ncbi:MAG: 3'-5' exonuclease [Candidatus Paceibacterota bacterium]
MIVLDTETTGIDPQKCSLLSIGALEFENPKNQFYGECRIFDGAVVHDKALEVNGFSEAEAVDPEKPSPGELLSSFFAWSKSCAERDVAGHNVTFDTGFLLAQADRDNLTYPFSHRVVDTYSLAWMHMVQSGEEIPRKGDWSSIDSDFIFNYVGISQERGEHNALEDAKLTAEAISRLAYNKQLLEEYQQFPIPWK